MTRTMNNETTYYIAYNSTEYATALKRVNNVRRARGKRFVHTNSKKANRAIESALSAAYNMRVVVSGRSQEEQGQCHTVYPVAATIHPAIRELIAS